MRQEIVDACAWMLWANAWVSLQDQLAEDGKEHVSPGAGGSWDPLVPEVPETVNKAATALVAAIERLNKTSIENAYLSALEQIEESKRDVPKPTVERFGTCLAYEAVGSGVGWADDYPEHGLKLPHIEVWADSDQSAYVSTGGRFDIE